MMKLYSMYDSKTESWEFPLAFVNRGTAFRAIGDEIDRGQVYGPRWKNHPADFTLFETGSWDPNTGKLETVAAPISLGTVLELFVAPKQNQADTLKAVN